MLSPPPNSMRRRPVGACSAFTLLELVIAMAVVAVLALLLFTAGGKGVEVADRQGCIANLREVTSAALAYATDHGGSMPGPTTSMQTWSISATADPRNGSALALWLRNYLPGTRSIPGSDRLLSTALLCPAYKRQLKSTELGENRAAYISSATTATDGVSRIFPFGYYSSSSSKPTLPMRVNTTGQEHSRITLLADTDAVRWPDDLRVSRRVLHGSVRHMIFLDGHVELQPVEGP